LILINTSAAGVHQYSSLLHHLASPVRTSAEMHVETEYV